MSNRLWTVEITKGPMDVVLYVVASGPLVQMSLFALSRIGLSMGAFDITRIKLHILFTQPL